MPGMAITGAVTGEGAQRMRSGTAGAVLSCLLPGPPRCRHPSQPPSPTQSLLKNSFSEEILHVWLQCKEICLRFKA